MACNPKTQAFIVDRDAIDPDEGIQELALFYPNGLPVSFGTIESEIDAEVVDARGTYPTLGDRLDAGGGGSGVSDHGALTGLTDDDHLRYAYSFDGDFISSNTVLSGSPRGLIVTGNYSVTMPNTTTPSMMGRVWAITNAYEDTITLNAGSSGALFNGTDQTFDIRSGRQIQVTLIDITGVGVIWGLGSLLPVPSSGGAIGVGDIVAGSNITLTPSADNQQITISASGSGGVGTNDHRELIGLEVDGHMQYARRRACTFVTNDITLPLHTDAWNGGLNSFVVTGNNSSITMPNTLNSNTYGRSYYITNTSNGIVNIYSGTSNADFLNADPSIFKLDPFKEVKITLLAIKIPGEVGTGESYWVVEQLQPSGSAGGAIGVNDITAQDGLFISGPQEGILPLRIGFSTNAAADIPFTPANAAHWPTQPTTVGEALNSLAARANALGG